MSRVTEINQESLLRMEPEGVARTSAWLAYNSSQGMALGEGSNEKFIEFVVKEVWPKLQGITNREAFREVHSDWVRRLQGKLRTTRGSALSYGQGQKSLNVWLKFYCDWASLPSPPIAERLRPWLHCPLDSVVMDGLKARLPDEYSRRIVPHYQRLGLYHQHRHLLSAMDEGLYCECQAWIESSCPANPVLVDLIWAFDR